MDERDPLHPGHGLNEWEVSYLIATVRADEHKKYARKEAKAARRVLKACKKQEMAVMVVKAQCKRLLDEARAEEREKIARAIEALPRWRHAAGEVLVHRDGAARLARNGGMK